MSCGKVKSPQNNKHKEIFRSGYYNIRDENLLHLECRIFQKLLDNFSHVLSFSYKT